MKTPRTAATLVLLGAALAGCAGDGATGAPGPQGALQAASAGGRATDCAPGALFCDGDQIWACHRSGVGATLVRDCAPGGTATNPIHCAADARCPAAEGVCCLPEKPPCAWNLISPVSVQGTQGAYLPSDSSCYARPWPPAPVQPDACGVTGRYYYPLYLSFSHRVAQCPEAYVTVSLSFDRTLVGPSNAAIALPNAGVSLSLTDATGPAACRAWTGTVTWVSDAPSWRVLVNAVCADGTGRTVAGEFWGDA